VVKVDMKTKISALVDGELERQEADAAFDALGAEGAARDTWRAYHLISDAMRDTRVLSDGFAARVAARLAEEPTVLAPRRRPILEQRRWQVRHTLTFRRSEIAEAGRELVSAAHLISQLDTGALWPVRNESPLRCGGCAFRDVCAATHDEELIDLGFERRVPKRDKELEAA